MVRIGFVVALIVLGAIAITKLDTNAQNKLALFGSMVLGIAVVVFIVSELLI